MLTFSAMGDHDEGIKLDEDELLGVEGDNADMTDDDHVCKFFINEIEERCFESKLVFRN